MVSLYLREEKDGKITSTLDIATYLREHNKNRTVFGRSEDKSDFTLKHPSLSRSHAAISCVNETWRLYDLNSANGTFLNERQLSQNEAATLQDGDVIRFGASSRQYRVVLSSSDDNLEGTPKSSTKPKTIKERQKDISQAVELFAKATGQGLPTQFGSKMGKAGVLARRAGLLEETELQDSATDAVSHTHSDAQQDATKAQYPVSKCIVLRGHEKTVCAVASDPSGGRIVTGSMDYHLKMYDFGGMDRAHRPFKEIEPEEQQIIKAIDFSPTGDKFIVATGSRQPQIFDREGNPLCMFVKGDTYLMDQSRTRGHTGEVTHAEWSPVERQYTLSSSMDGTVRWWDIDGPTAFDGELICAQTVRVKNANGGRVGATTCAYGPSAKSFYVAATDGSIQSFDVRVRVNRPSAIVRKAHLPGNIACTSISFEGKSRANPGNVFVSRGMDDTIKLWDIRKFQTPLATINGVPTLSPTSNTSWSPDGQSLVFGNSVTNPRQSGSFAIIDINSLQQHRSVDMSEFWQERKLDDTRNIVVASDLVSEGHSVVAALWHPKINQIFLGCGDCGTRVLFDENLSNKGALLSSSRIGKANVDTMDFATAPIVLPERQRRRRRDQQDLGTIPMDSYTGLVKYHELRRDAKATKKPEAPLSGPGKGVEGKVDTQSRTFQQHIMRNHLKRDVKDEDPREALLAYASEAKKGRFIGSAYATTQPKEVFHEETLEKELDDAKQSK